VSEAVAEKVEQGCYDLRGADFDTLLVGAVTPSIGDAARFVKWGRPIRGGRTDGWQNGFPNWAMYRTALCGDSHLAYNLRGWCEAFGIAHASEQAGIANALVGKLAGRDAYYWLTTKRWGAPATELAQALHVAPQTYRKLRGQIASRLLVSMEEYFMRLGIMLREVALMERKQETTPDSVRLSDGRGWGDEVSANGDGNYRAFPRGSGC